MANQLTKAQNNIGGELSRRSTEQRQLILEIIQRADRHLDADEIYERARHELPSISLSTVYRNLQLFKDLGVVEEHQFDGRRRYYETTPQLKHQHLVCLGCGLVFELKCPLAESIKSSWNGTRRPGLCPPIRFSLCWSPLHSTAVVEWLERWLGAWKGPRIRLAVVGILSLPMVVIPQINF